MHNCVNEVLTTVTAIIFVNPNPLLMHNNYHRESWLYMWTIMVSGVGLMKSIFASFTHPMSFRIYLMFAFLGCKEKGKVKIEK